jgi:hypothetical protein
MPNWGWPERIGTVMQRVTRVGEKIRADRNDDREARPCEEERAHVRGRTREPGMILARAMTTLGDVVTKRRKAGHRSIDA